MSGQVIEERFWAKVNKTPGCWLWTASIRGRGYGQCSIGEGKQGYAHRFSFELANGPIPAGMEIDHRCHNRLCVNPSHLRVVDRKQNMENLSGAYANNKSGVRGVWWVGRLRKWRASVRHNKEIAYAEWFDDLNQAEAAVTAKRLELFTHNDIDRKTSK
jgi:hypothetical protein